MKKLDFESRLRWRIRLQWCIMAAMLVYMIAVGELGGGDSRLQTRLAEVSSRLMFFGGLIYLGVRIFHNRKILNNSYFLKKQERSEADERNRCLHDRSGGIVLDILMVLLYFTVMTASMFDMPAFYTSFFILSGALILKGTVWLLASRGLI